VNYEYTVKQNSETSSLTFTELRQLSSIFNKQTETNIFGSYSN